ncbi:phosphoglycerate dehydrogenase [Frigidibacter mobilis]|uniref:D-isomer specific 2-hydroxyacid dehydrogenase NAD-binding protein n=1 Tax=Frigidibacter mobilis TaxID=1335048 RepID=A0A159Z1Q7_9RHOB|nr:phosphoglycerate dehydrogenase [Frigidibacter mobilis]AMY68897.1 D-isomer specific 2-hydroxyacid dehydrogenase NAD-binding protein [Frigidibacter mobilis]
MSNRRVLVTQRFFDDATIRYLRDNGCAVSIAEFAPGQADGGLSHDDLVNLLDGFAGWIVGHAHVTRELLKALPDLKVISRRGVGYDRVDLDAARDLGRVVCIAAGGNDASVADHTIALMLAVGHRFRETQTRMIEGDFSILTGRDLFESTVGIVGMGRIGRSLAERLQGFRCRILAVSGRDLPPGVAPNVEITNLDTLTRESDYISVHAPLTAETRFMFDAERIAQMKPSSFLINTARGGLVDDRALLAALKAGAIAGAGLDVYVSESDPTYKPVTEELVRLPNVIATPHAAASTVEGLARTNMVAARSVVAVFDGGTPLAECVVADGRRA